MNSLYDMMMMGGGYGGYDPHQGMGDSVANWGASAPEFFDFRSATAMPGTGGYIPWNTWAPIHAPWMPLVRGGGGNSRPYRGGNPHQSVSSSMGPHRPVSQPRMEPFSIGWRSAVAAPGTGGNSRSVSSGGGPRTDIGYMGARRPYQIRNGIEPVYHPRTDIGGMGPRQPRNDIGYGPRRTDIGYGPRQGRTDIGGMGPRQPRNDIGYASPRQPRTDIGYRGGNPHRSGSGSGVSGYAGSLGDAPIGAAGRQRSPDIWRRSGGGGREWGY